MTKSQKIRDFKSANPQASAAEIQSALKKEKIKVSLPLVYQVLAKKPSKKPMKTDGSVSVEILLEAKRVVAQTGSIEEARRALDLLGRLTK